MASTGLSDNDLCGLAWIRRTAWPRAAHPGAPAISLVDLFCGCGGLTLGAWEAARVNQRRLDIRLAVDTCSDAISVYRHNFDLSAQIACSTDVRDLLPGHPGDRLRAAERQLRDSVGKLDVLVAGPPCQGHSDLNNHTRRDDPRNGLYLSVVRAAEVLRPSVVLIENVGAVIHDRSRVVQCADNLLAGLGYRVATRMVRALALGLPQRRKRHILLALRDHDDDPDVFFPAECSMEIPVSDYIADIEDEPRAHQDLFHTPSRMTRRNVRRVAYLFDHDVYDLPNHKRPRCHRNGHSYKSMYGRLHWDKPAQTITTGFGSMGQGRFVHARRARMITPHEASRLQGIPDFFDLTGVRRRAALQAMIGNAVPPQIGAKLLSRLLEIFDV